MVKGLLNMIPDELLCAKAPGCNIRPAACSSRKPFVRTYLRIDALQLQTWRVLSETATHTTEMRNLSAGNIAADVQLAPMKCAISNVLIQCDPIPRSRCQLRRAIGTGC